MTINFRAHNSPPRGSGLAWELGTCGRSLYDVGSGNIPNPTESAECRIALAFCFVFCEAPDPEQRGRLCRRPPFLTSTKSIRSGKDSCLGSQTKWPYSDPPWRHSIAWRDAVATGVSPFTAPDSAW